MSVAESMRSPKELIDVRKLEIRIFTKNTIFYSQARKTCRINKFVYYNWQHNTSTSQWILFQISHPCSTVEIDELMILESLALRSGGQASWVAIFQTDFNSKIFYAKLHDVKKLMKIVLRHGCVEKIYVWYSYTISQWNITQIVLYMKLKCLRKLNLIDRSIAR